MRLYSHVQKRLSRDFLVYYYIEPCASFVLLEFRWCLNLAAARADFGWGRRERRTSITTTLSSHNTTTLYQILARFV
jgi:hypothetical protein